MNRDIKQDLQLSRELPVCGRSADEATSRTSKRLWDWIKNNPILYEIDFESVIIAFEKITGKKTKIIIRLHPNAAFQKKYITFSDNIIDGNIYPDIKDLSLVSNAVISDYSSSLFDFALLEKPAFVCALDYEDYKEKRGFIKEFYEFPFPIAKSNYELIKIITSFDLKEYRENLREFYKKYPVYSDGHSAEKTADWVLKHMKIWNLYSIYRNGYLD